MNPGDKTLKRLPDAIAAGDQQLVQLTDLAFASAAQRSGPHLVCKPGCTQCCHGAFAINALDAWRLREGMKGLERNDPLRAQAVRDRATSYMREYGEAFPGDLHRGVLGTSEEEQEAFGEFANEAACPALDPATGLCDLYEARPMTCRVFGPPVRSVAVDPGAGSEEVSASQDNDEQQGLAVCELCFTEATEAEIVAAEMHPPRAEEEALLSAFTESGATSLSPDEETIIAWCLAQS